MRRSITVAVRYCWVLALAWPLVASGDPDAGHVTQQRRLEAGWLTLEQDRRDYQARHPAGSGSQRAQQSLRLEQQRLRDVQDLRRLGQDYRVRPRRIEVPGHPRSSPKPPRRLGTERALRGMQLHNRMQRFAWPAP
jgi:hypothetical protein